MGQLMGGSIVVAASTAWLVTLVVTGFSAFVVSIGLLAALYVLNGTGAST
jgi:hypothetical protein